MSTHQHLIDDPHRPFVLTTMAGFTKQQIESLDALFDRELNILFDRLQDHFRSSAPPSAQLSAPSIAHLPASPPAPQACASTPPELPPQRPPQPICPLPPTDPPSVLEEVEHTWKHRASKAVPTIRVSKTFENCIEGPPKSGGIHMRFSRDEEPDAWYTTMLNHRQKLVEALPHPA